jgi:hypothetical protein
MGPGPARREIAPAAMTTSAATGQCRRVGRTSTAARNTGITTSSVKNPNPGPTSSERLVSSSEIIEAAVATSSTCRGLTAHAAPRIAIAPMANADSRTESGSKTARPPMIQRSTSTAEPTTTTRAILRTRRNGVATRAGSTLATLTTLARRAPRPIGRCADQPTTV